MAKIDGQDLEISGGDGSVASTEDSLRRRGTDGTSSPSGSVDDGFIRIEVSERERERKIW